jgi:hypothetical protein
VLNVRSLFQMSEDHKSLAATALAKWAAKVNVIIMVFVSRLNGLRNILLLRMHITAGHKGKCCSVHGKKESEYFHKSKDKV